MLSLEILKQDADTVLAMADYRGAIVAGTCPSTPCTTGTLVFPQSSEGIFGEVLYNSGPPSWYGTLLDGQTDGSGYIYKRNRYLDPTAGHFTQEDPLGLAGGLNVYGYANGDPVNFSDPFGLFSGYDEGPATEARIRALREIGVAHPNLAVTAALAMVGASVEQAVGEVAGAAIRLLGALRAVRHGVRSPDIHPSEVAGRTPDEIDALAREKGLVPKGPDPKNGRGAYVDPETGEQRILSHPNAPRPRAHVNDPTGHRLDISGNPVAPESKAAHLPIGEQP